MLVDLGMLIFIGCILEGLVTKVSGLVINAAPTITVGMLITFVAVMRWNLKGLLVVPFMVVANYIGGQFNDIEYLAAIYDWKLALASCIALCVVGLNVIFYKKFGTKRVMLNILAVIGLIAMNYILYNEVLRVLYRTFTSGSPLVIGSIPFDALDYDVETESYVERTFNLCLFVQKAGIYNIISLCITGVGIFLLRSQGVVNNVVDKLIEDREIAKEIQNAEHFSVPDVDEFQSNEKTENQSDKI